MDELSLPAATSYGLVILVFFAALAMFHFALVWLWPLGKMGWKIVDYIWLTGALLGILGGVVYARQVVAEGRLALADARVETQATWVSECVAFGTSGAVCRQFVRSDFSPSEQEFARLQREFDALCAWFRQAAERTPAILSERSPVTLEELGGTPPPHGADPWYVNALLEQVERYNALLTAKNRLAAEARLGDMKVSLAVLSPYFLAVVLALRLCKVTGEIRLERTSKTNSV